MSTNVIAWMIIVAGAIAVWHFIYEAIILPSLRAEASFKLFALRDRLRSLKAANPESCDDEPFHMLDDSLSWRMDNLPRLTFVFLAEAMKRVHEDASLRSEIEERLALLESCKLPEYVAIRQESNQLTMDVIAMNSGGLVAYVLPIAAASVAWERLSRAVRRLNAIPQDRVDDMSLCPA